MDGRWRRTRLSTTINVTDHSVRRVDTMGGDGHAGKAKPCQGLETKWDYDGVSTCRRRTGRYEDLALNFHRVGKDHLPIYHGVMHLHVTFDNPSTSKRGTRNNSICDHLALLSSPLLSYSRDSICHPPSFPSSNFPNARLFYPRLEWRHVT